MPKTAREFLVMSLRLFYTFFSVATLYSHTLTLPLTHINENHLSVFMAEWVWVECEEAGVVGAARVHKYHAENTQWKLKQFPVPI